MQADIDVGRKAIGIEPEHAVDVELPDAQQLHLGLGRDLDRERARTEGELEAPADLHHAADLQHALQYQADAGVDGDVAKHEETSVRIGRQDIRQIARVRRVVLLVGLETRDGLGRQVGVDLEQELAVDGDDTQQQPVGAACELHAADDAGALAIEVGIELQVEAAAQSANKLDIGADRTGDAHIPVAVDVAGRGERDEAAQRNGVEQLDAALDVGGHIELGVHPYAFAAVDLRRRRIHRNRGRRIVGQQSQETLRNLEHLLAQRGVEHDHHGAAQLEDAVQGRGLVAAVGAVRRRAQAQLQIEHHRDTRQAGAAAVGVDDQQADRLAVQAQRRNLGLGLHEDLKTLGRDAQEEAAEQPHRVGGVFVRGAVFLDLERTDDFYRERLGRQYKGLALGQQVEFAGRGGRLEEIRGAEFAVGFLGDDLPLLALDDGAHNGAAAVRHEVLDRRGGRVGVYVAQIPAGGGQIDFAQYRTRQGTGAQREVLLDGVTRNALQRDLFSLGRRSGVYLQHRAAVGEDAVVLEEVEVRLDLRNAPELGRARHGVAGLQHEARRRRADIAQLDYLDGAVGVHAEAFYGAAVGQHVVADFQRHAAADVDDGLVGKAQALQLDAAGNINVENLAGRLAALAVVLLERADDLEALRAVLARVAVLVGPVGTREADRHRAFDETAADVITQHVFVGLVDDAIAVVVDTVVAAGEPCRRAGQQLDAVLPAEAGAGQREFARGIGKAGVGQRHAAGAGITHVDPAAVGLGGDGNGRRRTGRVRRRRACGVQGVEAACNQRELQRADLEAAGVPVAESRAGVADTHRGLAVVERERAGAGRDGHRELGIEVGDAGHVYAVIAVQAEGDVEVTPVV